MGYSAPMPFVFSHPGEPVPAAPGRADLIIWRMRAGLSVAQCCALCGVHRTTWARYESGQLRVPLCVFRLVMVCAGVIPHRPWADWSFGADGKLYAPTDQLRGFTPTHLYSARWWRQLARSRSTVQRSSPGADITSGARRAAIALKR